MNIRIEHEWPREELARRLESLAREHGVAVEGTGDGVSGRLDHKTPVGRVRARYRVLERVLEVEIEKKPAFVPADLVRRRVEEGLREILTAER